QHIAERLDARRVEVDVGGAIEVRQRGAVVDEGEKTQFDAADLFTRRFFSDGEHDHGTGPLTRAEALNRAAQGDVILPDVVAQAVRGDEQHVRAAVDAERGACSGAIARIKRPCVYAVR